VTGDLFSQADQTLDLLMTKYTRAMISYEGTTRLDTPPVPREALREAIHNAIVHKDYGSSIPVQIRVYEDKIRMWNACILPEGWDLSKLTGPHPSDPHNPDIAGAFFRTGKIESWGRGIEKIYHACESIGNPSPVYELELRGMWLEFPFSQEYKDATGNIKGSTDQNTTPKKGITGHDTGHDTRHDTEQVKRLLSSMALDREYTRAELMDELSMNHRETFSENYLKPALKLGYIEMTIPDKPKSKNQRYRVCYKKQLGDSEK
jgi:ATP-dependent DNA helicase RecG